MRRRSAFLNSGKRSSAHGTRNDRRRQRFQVGKNVFPTEGKRQVYTQLVKKFLDILDFFKRFGGIKESLRWQVHSYHHSNQHSKLMATFLF